MAFRLNKKLKKRLAAIVLLALLILLLILLANYPAVVEKYYSRGFYRFICIVLHAMLNIFPFSIGDILYILVVAGLIVAVAKIITSLFKRKFEQALKFFLTIIIGIETGIVIFYLFWGMNYYRIPAAERLGYKNTTYTTNQLKKITLILIDSTNATRARLIDADMRTPNDSIYKTAVAAVKQLSETSVNFRTYSPKVKPSALTPLINYLSTSGYYNPFTAEAQINFKMPVQLRPFVACHELSHQMGFGFEDEASFAGFIAGVNSNDKLLRYSVYYEGMREFMIALGGVDTIAFKQYKKRLSGRVRADLKAEREYWQYYEGRLEVISGIFYDKFLKANNQPQGLATYNQMVTLVMAWYNRQPGTHKVPVKVR
ncbi:MAG: DUF3810 domain-containing protein [Sphingobacteriaceae bacterium]|nr:MAG: DUF3810 domain-containing protein [Sphingobacteriaceae bacterium]